MKQANGKTLHTVWFNLCDINKTAKVQGQKSDEQLLRVIPRDIILGRNWKFSISWLWYIHIWTIHRIAIKDFTSRWWPSRHGLSLRTTTTKLQLEYRTIIAQNREIELNGKVWQPPGWHCLTCLGDPQRLCPTQITGPPRLLFHMKGWSWLELLNFLNPLKQAIAGHNEPQSQY